MIPYTDFKHALQWAEYSPEVIASIFSNVVSQKYQTLDKIWF